MRLSFASSVFISTLLFASGFRTAAQEHTFKIAFGSCNRQSTKIQPWQDIIAQKPNVFMWIGDNVYADTHNMDSLRSAYDFQKKHPDYQQLKKNASVIGTWDDHDYGINDGGKFFSKKEQSKLELLNFLDVPKDAEVRSRAGVYQSFTYGKGAQTVKVILLDTRSFRDTLIRVREKESRYLPNPDGDILGEAQWAWLENELTNSKARVHIIASSIQVLATEHRFEKWSNFPKARQRLFDLLVKTKAVNAIFVSGDRHIAEFSKIKLPGLNYAVYDFTSSGLTHTWTQTWEENNALRVGKMIIEKNFGLIIVDWKKKRPVVTMQVRGIDNKLFAEVKTDFKQ